MTFKVLLEKKARRQIEDLNEDTKKRIFLTLNELEKGFSARLDIKKLKGYDNHYRIRVGDYRILFFRESSTAKVYDVSHRHDVYKGKD